MNTEYSEPNNSEQDAIYIPTEGGFEVIPMSNLRGQVDAKKKRSHPNGQSEAGHAMDQQTRKIDNVPHLAFSVLGLIGIIAFIGWQIGGLTGLFIAMVLGGTSIFVKSRAKIETILRMKKPSTDHHDQGV